MTKYVNLKEDHHVLYLDDTDFDLIVELLEQLIIETELQHEEQVKKKEETGDIPDVDYPDSNFIADNILSKIKGVECYETESLLIKERVEPVTITKEQKILLNMTPFIYEGGYIPIHGKARYYLPRYTPFSIETEKGTIFSADERYTNYISIRKWKDMVKELNLKENDIIELTAIENLKYRVRKVTEQKEPPLILKHKLIESEPDYKWFSAKIRLFLGGYGMLPPTPQKGKVPIQPIYDDDGNKYEATLDYQNRIWCREWYEKFRPKLGDEIVVMIDGKNIKIYPAD